MWRDRLTDPCMFAARPTSKRPTATTQSSALFSERALPVLTLTHAAQVDDGRAGGTVGRRHSRHRRRVHGASLAVCSEPQTPDVAAPFKNVRQRRCTQSKHAQSNLEHLYSSSWSVVEYSLGFYKNPLLSFIGLAFRISLLHSFPSIIIGNGVNCPLNGPYQDVRLSLRAVQIKVTRSKVKVTRPTKLLCEMCHNWGRNCCTSFKLGGSIVSVNCHELKKRLKPWCHKIIVFVAVILIIIIRKRYYIRFDVSGCTGSRNIGLSFQSPVKVDVYIWKTLDALL